MFGQRATGILDWIGNTFGGQQQPQTPQPIVNPLNQYQRRMGFNQPRVSATPIEPLEFGLEQVGLGQTDYDPTALNMPNTTVASGLVEPIPQPEQPQEQGFMSKVGDYLGNEENRLQMALAFNTMRLEPDDALAQSIENRLENIRARKGSNKTVASLQNMLNQPGISDEEKFRLQSIIKGVQDGVITPAEAYTQALKRKSAPLVHMGEGEYLKHIMSNIADRQALWTERGEMARNTLNTYAELNRSIQSFGDTGPGEEFKQDLRVLADKVGLGSLIDESKMNDAQYIQATKNRLVAEELRRNKGPQTDFDAEFAGTYIPGLGIGTEANQKLISYGQSIALQQQIFSDMSNSVSLGDTKTVRAMHQKINQLANASPGAIPRDDGSYMTFKEFFNSDAIVNIDGKDVSLSSLTAVERLEKWAETADKLMGYKR